MFAPRTGMFDCCNACCEAVHSPIEFMIADDPGVVLEMIQQIDHQRPSVSEADISALIHVADIDQDRVGIFLPPAFDLCRAARQSAAIWNSIIIETSGEYGRANPSCAGSRHKPCRDSSAAAALASVGTALTSPARPTSFRKSRRPQTLSCRSIAAKFVLAEG